LWQAPSLQRPKRQSISPRVAAAMGFWSFWLAAESL
jgi:hypothetical protein